LIITCLFAICLFKHNETLTTSVTKRDRFRRSTRDCTSATRDGLKYRRQ